MNHRVEAVALGDPYLSGNSSLAYTLVEAAKLQR